MNLKSRSQLKVRNKLNENFKENKQLDLDGFSGNKIEVIRSLDKTFVRKTAKNIEENYKIKKEIEKLEKLNKISKKFNQFKIPEIKLSNYNKNELLYYEIEFIAGENFDSSLQKLSSDKIKNYSKKLNEIINTFSQNSLESKVDEKEFLKQKFIEVINKIERKNLTTNLGRELFDEYCKKIENLEINKKDVNNKSTFCHGDLALDNILITRKNEIYLIDPLHNDFENIMWDYAKILQSSMAHWNLIKYQNFRLISNNKKIIIPPNEHITMFHQDFLKHLKKENMSSITVYLAATLARVAKYSKTEKQLCALLIIINELLTDYSNGKCDLSGTFNSLRR